MPRLQKIKPTVHREKNTYNDERSALTNDDAEDDDDKGAQAAWQQNYW